MTKLKLAVLIIFVFLRTISVSSYEVQTNHVLVITSTKEDPLKDTFIEVSQKVYNIAGNIAKKENVYFIDSYDSLKVIVDYLSSRLGENDLLLTFMVGHGKGYASDPINESYGFSAVLPIVYEKEQQGFGKSFRENNIIWWGPRINNTYKHRRGMCVGLNKKELFFDGTKGSHGTFQCYGMKFVADVNKLELVDCTIIDDHSDWIKVIYYYAKSDLERDCILGQELFYTNNDNKLDGDDVSEVAFRVDRIYSSYAYGEYNIDNIGTEDYMFIVHTDSGPKIAVSLNPGTSNILDMPIHGFIEEDGYIHSLDFNQDGDWDDFLYFNEEYEIGQVTVPNHQLVELFYPISSKKAFFANYCYSGGLHDVFNGDNTGTYTSATDGTATYMVGYLEGCIKAIYKSGDKFTGDKEELTLADIHNAGYNKVKSHPSLGQFWSVISYCETGQDYICGPVTGYNGFSSTIVAYGDGRTVSAVQDKRKVLIPKEVTLFQNYPNPFNPTTTISFSLPKTDYVELDIFNISGERVMSLGRPYDVGQYQIVFDATKFSSGTYIYRLKVGDQIQTKKMILMK